jgi:cohesin loading factor subunit SCC2
MAENFSALDYKTQEEVHTVIQHLTSVLSTAGMQLVEFLSPSHLLAQLGGPAETRPGPSVAVVCPLRLFSTHLINRNPGHDAIPKWKW